MLDATRLLYTTPSRPVPSPYENSDSESSNSTDSRFTKRNNVSTFTLQLPKLILKSRINLFVSHL